MVNIHYALNKKQNLTVDVYGENKFDREYKEINYYIQYQNNGFSIVL
jgi:hypothetical protein